MAQSRTIGLLREVKNKWERRVALCPDQVAELVKKGIRVLVQPSERRIFKDIEYKQVGATITEDLSPASVIFGVKEFPHTNLIPNRAYVMFSHVIKAQPYNMHFMDQALAKNVRLFDYECIRQPPEQGGQRLVAFGRYAGNVGMIDMFRGMGERLLSMGYSTPFMGVSSAVMYPSLEHAMDAVTFMGKEIGRVGLPLQPMTFSFTGYGNVAQGAMEIFKLLPVQWVDPADLPRLPSMLKSEASRRLVYGCALPTSALVEHNDPAAGKFVEADYFAHPENYHPVFHEKIAPHTSCLVNGIYWESKFPRLLTIEQLKQLDLAPNGRKLIGVADVSCDIEGSIEFLKRATTIDRPFFMYDPWTGNMSENLEAPGVLVLGVDNLPTEIPLTASRHFGKALLPFVESLVSMDLTKPITEAKLPYELKSACILADGKLTPPFEYITKLRDPALEAPYAPTSAASTQAKKRVLVLGAGFVCKPMVEYLHNKKMCDIRVASLSLAESKQITDSFPGVEPVGFDVVQDKERLTKEIRNSDIVVSYLPATFHPMVAEICLAEKKHMATASYISPALHKMHKAAKEAGLIWINEAGLDPGIDILSARKVIDDAKAQGGRVFSFESWCGGLPAPEASDNPLGYKFSWAPLGVLNATNNSALFRRNGKTVTIEPQNLLLSSEPFFFNTALSLEAYPNRDSLAFEEPYDLMGVETMYRGTLRYKGYCDKMFCMKQLGLFDATPQAQPLPTTWKGLMGRLLGTTNDLPSAIRKQLAARGVAKAKIDEAVSCAQWLDLHTDKAVVPAMSKNIIGAFCNLLQEKLAYKKGERDMILLVNRMGIRRADGSKDAYEGSLLCYGDSNGYSAMAKTVGLPTAIAVQMMLEGRVKQRGVIAPVMADLYQPMLDELAKLNIRMVESCKRM